MITLSLVFDHRGRTQKGEEGPVEVRVTVNRKPYYINTGVKVTSKNMRPGDLIFYANKSGTINHVGMYIGNGQVVNAASRRSGIRIYRWNYRTPVAIRNVIGN